jgi:hypothetical protein
MQSLQELSDRWEINQRMIDYATAVDTLQIELLDRVFTPDAYIDYRACGMFEGHYPRLKQFFLDDLVNNPRYHHILANANITLSGDEATSRTMCFEPLEATLADGTTQVMFLCWSYVDRHVRTADGWRIADRRVRKGIRHNVPPKVAEFIDGVWDESATTSG